jgi:hypothetical protein
MSYPFPDIQAQCPICERAECAVYRGYYLRFMFCPEMEFVGKVAIRTGYCRHNDVRFSFLPDFMIRNKKISRLSLNSFHEHFKKQNAHIKRTIDEWIGELGDEFYVAISTAHSWCSLVVAVPP